MVHADGTGATTVLDADDLFEVYDLDWSPDGSRLAVLYHPVDPPTAGLLTIGPDGSGRTIVGVCQNGDDSGRICPPNGGGVQWSADGSSLAFANFQSSGHVLIVLGPDGEITPLSEGFWLGCCLAWQPAGAR